MAMSVNNIHPPLFKNKVHPCDNNSEYLGEEDTTNNDHLNIAFMNTRGQTGLDLTKQAQIESFLKFHRIDILNCQETNVSEDTFSQSHSMTSSYEIISNNAINKYGTSCLISNNFTPKNIKMDTEGRIIKFDIENITFCNVYLPSGNDASTNLKRENYIAETLPALLLNSQNIGLIGGDWNCITEKQDATRNVSSKMSTCLKRVIRNFCWKDSFRSLYPNKGDFSRYYNSILHGDGATRIDRVYHYGSIIILKAEYVPVAFSDHLSLVIRVKIPEQLSRLRSPQSKPLFKANPEVVVDDIFQARLKEAFKNWSEVKNRRVDVLTWWELLVKPGIRKLLIERGKEMCKERRGLLNLLLLRQSYLVKKIQSGKMSLLGDLKTVQNQIQQWYKDDCEKIKLQARAEEFNKSEGVRIYHHELHAKKIKRTSIIKLDTGSTILTGHRECAEHLEQSVSDLLLHPASLSEAAQQELLQEVKPVFTEADNALLKSFPTKKEVKESVWSSNLHAAPGNDGLTSFVYYYCWDTLGEALTEVVQAIHRGGHPTWSQRTSLMMFGTKPKKGSSIKVSDKRRLSQLNSDFKVITGIENGRFKQTATHTLSHCQLAVGNDRRVHHGINTARDAITVASGSKEGVGILDNDYKAAFDFMVLYWVLKVLKAKGLDQAVIDRLNRLYSNNFTIVVVNNLLGKCIPNNYMSIRQGDRPSSILFCFGIDPHLIWLERRLLGISIYKQAALGPLLPGAIFKPQVEARYKVFGYIDDIKPAIT